MSSRILVVDDDETMVRTLCDILALHGWEAAGVYSGEQAIDAVSRERFAAVLMDVRMPGIDGVTALQRLKALAPDLRVLMMTAHTASDLHRQAARHGAAHVLTKPLQIETLLGLLR